MTDLPPGLIEGVVLGFSVAERNKNKNKNNAYISLHLNEIS